MGTWAPLLVFAVVLVTYFDWRGGPDPLLLGVIYVVTFFTFLEGITALVLIARNAVGVYPAGLTVMFLYQKVLTAVVVGMGMLRVWGIVEINDALFVAVVAGAFAAHGIFNNVLFFGRTREWHNTPVDPVPLRPLWKELRKKSGRRD